MLKKLIVGPDNFIVLFDRLVCRVRQYNSVILKTVLVNLSINFIFMKFYSLVYDRNFFYEFR